MSRVLQPLDFLSVRNYDWGAQTSNKVESMFQHSQRGTVVWLGIVGVALLLLLIAGDVSAVVLVPFLAIYVTLMFLVARHVPVGEILETLTTRMTPALETSPSAREAMARARTYPDYESLIQLLDIGLIVDEPRPDGMALRRGRFISLDDDGVRPFGIIHVPVALAGRMSRVRFELRDGSGEPQYVFETEKWLDAGENALLPDYRLPIKKNAERIASGGWSAHLEIDNGVLGVHHFNVSEGLSARRDTIAPDGEIRERVWRSEEGDDSLPLSLEELLREQGRRQYKEQ